ncbi:MAG: hypothetical protein OER95_15640 [Acidimicrobiia bacterium]|nr:hypothetical protein [Acidimicrobiia bacterium]
MADYRPNLVYTSPRTQSEFKDSLGDAANGITIHSAWHPAATFTGSPAGEDYVNEDFIDGFTAAFDRRPDADGAIPFAVCQGMEQAIIGADTTGNAAIKEWMSARTAADPAQTVMGPFSWDDRGLGTLRERNRLPALLDWD